jgi:hypothetical protein
VTFVGLAIAAALAASAGDLRLKDKISLATFYSPHRDAISSESWIAYEIANGYSIGVAYVWESRKFRPVSSVRFVEERAWHPGLSLRSGFRSVADGQVKDTLMLHQTFGNLQIEAGIAFGSGLARVAATTSYSFRNGFVAGLQADGRNVVTFLSYAKGRPILAGYLVNWKHPAYLIGWRF